MSNQFKQRYGDWALITGGTSGIGAEIASQLAGEGMNIVLVARKEQDLIAQTERLQRLYKVKTQYISADLATQQGMEKVTQVNQDIALLVHAAGVEVSGAFEKTPLEKEMQLVQLNVTSTLYLSHFFAQQMVARKRGGILLVSSLVSHMVSPYFANYAGSKSYVLNLGAALYGELKPKGVDVSVLSPGLTNTAMAAGADVDWSKLPMAQKEPAAVAELALSRLGKRFLTIPGLRNKIMSWMMNLTPFGLQATIDQKMMVRAIPSNRL